MKFTRRFTALGILACSIAIGSARRASAGGVVTDCGDDAALSSALLGGGTVSFDCSGTHQPATIDLRSTQTISGDVHIDGGGKITLTGEGSLRLFYVNQNAKLFLENVALARGFSRDDGGAIYNAGLLTLVGTTIVDSTAQGNGGAIATAGPVNMTGGGLARNVATAGGALSAGGFGARVTIVGSALTGNRALTSNGRNGKGGAVYASTGANVAVNLSEVSGNHADETGGGISIDGNAAAGLTASSVHHNDAAAGAGIMNLLGTLTMSMSTVSQNTASVTGGGIKNESGLAFLTNVTISGNRALGGGGFYNYNAQSSLTNVTIANNGATNVGGGITNSSFGTPHLTMRNVLFVRNAQGGNCFLGADPDASFFNLSTDGTCGLGVFRDNVAVTLGELETNGGATLTHRLPPGSAAIDAGTIGGCPSGDQRAAARYYLHSCDVGAVEFVACAGAPPAPTLLTPLDKEVRTLSDVVFDWSGPDCASGFDIVIRRGSKTGRIVHSFGGIWPNTQFSISDLPRGRKYFWQVTACNAAGCTAGAWRSFKITRKP